MPTDEFDPNDPGVPVSGQGVGENDGSNIEDVLGKAFDEQVSDGPEETPEEVPGGGSPTPESAGGEEVEPQGDGSPSADPLEAPSHWPSDQREQFSKLTPEMQRFMMDRFNGMEAAHTQRSQAIAPMRDVLERWGPYFQQTGARPDVAFDNLVGVEYRLRTGTQQQRIDVLREIIEAYGIEAPVDGEGNVREPVRDERVDALAQQMQQMTQMNQSAMQQQRIAAVQREQTKLDSFVSEKNEDGTLKRPYFGDVEAEMTMLAQADVNSGKQPDLDSLYERACWMNPAVRAKMMQSESARKAETARRKRNAGASVAGAGTGRPEQPKSIDDILNEAWDKQAAA